MAVSFDTEIQFLKGIGEKRAGLLHKLGIDTVGDLVNHYPRDYIDLTEPVSVLHADPNEPCAIRAMVLSKSGEQHIRKGLSVFKVWAVDPDGTELLLTFFNSKFTVDKLRVEEEYVFYGKVTGSLLRREMNSPLIFTLAEARQLIRSIPKQPESTPAFWPTRFAWRSPACWRHWRRPFPPTSRRRISSATCSTPSRTSTSLPAAMICSSPGGG